jgi:hypothetical protein
MTDKGAIKIMHRCLSNHSKWYVEPFAPDGMEDIVNEAMTMADYGLKRMSVFALYQRYRKWKETDPFMGKDAHLFHEFINHVAWDLGKSALKGSDQLLFEENCNLTVKWIKS